MEQPPLDLKNVQERDGHVEWLKELNSKSTLGCIVIEHLTGI
jgi:hypothetical protein